MKLKCCPFCGSKETLKLVHLPFDIGFFIKCGRCDSSSGAESKKSHAIQRWNNNYRENEN